MPRRGKAAQLTPRAGRNHNGELALLHRPHANLETNGYGCVGVAPGAAVVFAGVVDTYVPFFSVQ